MYNPQFNPYGGYGAYGPQTPLNVYGNKPQPKCTQPVTAEMSKMLYQGQDDLSVKISKIDSIKNQCTHKEPGTGKLAINPNADGTVTCRTCGETFHLIENPEKDIEEIKEKVVDILQTIKTLYVDAPEDFIKEYFQIISLINRMPNLYKKAANNFAMYEMYTGAAYTVNPGLNTFQAVNNIMNFNPMMNPTVGYAGPYGAPQYAQPQYGYQAAPPQPGQPMPGQPVPPQPGAQVDMWGNPIPGPYQTVPQYAPYGYQAAPPQPGQPMPGQPPVPDAHNPMAYNVAPNPAQTAAPIPTGPAQQNGQQVQQGGEVTQTKTFNV